MTSHVILSEAKDLKLGILRSFGVFAPQDDGGGVIRSGAKDLKMRHRLALEILRRLRGF